MQHDYHAHFNLPLSVVQKQHKVYLDVLDRIAQSGSILCFALKLLPSLYTPYHPNYVDHR